MIQRYCCWPWRVVTFGLFYLMQWLIHSDGSALTDGPDGRVLDFVRVEQDEELQVKNRKPKPPPPPDEPPPDAPDPRFQRGAIGVDMGSIGMDANLEISGDGGFTADGEYLPIVKVAPVYPRRALTRGIEGYVLLEFTVTKLGRLRTRGGGSGSPVSSTARLSRPH